MTAPVYELVEKTPLQKAHNLSKRLDNFILLKREDLQSIFSFKSRGAYNRISKLSIAEKKLGIVAASAGNHAQGAALSAQKLGINALIVMPKTTPDIKIESVKNLGATVELFGNDFNECYDYAIKKCEMENRVFIHPFDHLDTIAGQGTIGLEIIKDFPKGLDYIFIPVGGGGLISGVASILKQFHPQTKIVGVEPYDAACMTVALKEQKLVNLKQVGPFVDGVAVKTVGKHCFNIAQKCVDDMICVDVDDILSAIQDIFEDTRSIAEPAGALALAGMKKYIQKHTLKKQNIASIVSGANINFERLRHIAERTHISDYKECLLAITIDERIGAFKEICDILAKNMNISEFNYRYSNSTSAEIFVGVQLKDATRDRNKIFAELTEKKYNFVDLSRDELAITHLRHMVGGKASKLVDEKIFRFEFPERQGALLRFLNLMSTKWNISLFHYRNNGSAVGRVLAGIQVPKDDEITFYRSLDLLDYKYIEETDNLGYKKFLQPTL